MSAIRRSSTAFVTVIFNFLCTTVTIIQPASAQYLQPQYIQPQPNQGTSDWRVTVGAIAGVFCLGAIFYFCMFSNCGCSCPRCPRCPSRRRRVSNNYAVRRPPPPPVLQTRNAWGSGQQQAPTSVSANGPASTTTMVNIDVPPPAYSKEGDYPTNQQPSPV